MDIMWFSDLDKSDVGIAGGKGANLGELVRAGLPIPPGFVVTAGMYNKFLRKSGINGEIMGMLKKTNVDDSKALQRSSKKIRHIIRKTGMPEGIKSEILRHYKKLCNSGGKSSLVAIRSSATAEDLPGASFAGQQDTFLNVGGDDVAEKVQECWSSLYTPRAIFYREKKGFNHEDVSIAVVVQRMINADKSGVMFTVHPATGEKEKLIIEAGWGLGEGVVSGAVTPDHYVVDKRTGEVIDKEIMRKEIMYVRSSIAGGTETRKVPADKAEEQVLTESEIKKLADLGKLVEEHYDFPQDIEWAIEGGELYLLQSRPITVFYGEEKAEESARKDVLIKGLGASPGLGSGKVKIIFSTDELDKVKEGDVLVTTMTNPDMVPAMRRASAIVTEEGGMTCFAGGTAVLTKGGLKNISAVYDEIKNDKKVEVASFNPETYKVEWRRVKKAMKRSSELWRVSFSQTGRVLENCIDLTPDHKMVTFDKREIVDRKISELIENGEHVCIADKIPISNPNTIAQPELAYLCGAIFADGYINANTRRGYTTFTQKMDDSRTGFIEEVKTCFKNVFVEELGYEREKIAGGMIRDSPINAKKLKNIKKDLQSFVLHLTDDAALRFLGGVIDGDGSFSNNRINIFIGDNELLKATVLACLRLGISPQVTRNRDIYNLQITEKIELLLGATKRVKGNVRKRTFSTKLFSARQLLGDIVDEVNLGGRVKPYVKGNLLIGRETLLKIAEEYKKEEVEKLANSDFRMYRATKIKELGEAEVYNIEVENNHTYLVFTERLTPVIVFNCHAAIVSRELGIPCIVGTSEATKVLSDGDEITVDGSRGVVYRGLTEKKDEKPQEAAQTVQQKIITATEVKANISLPEIAPRMAPIADGVGLLRVEHMILGIGKHPIKFIHEGQEEELIEKLAEGVRKVAEAFYPKPVWYRSLDAPTDEFRSLEGGEEEPVEHNPMLGWRGIRRSLDQEELLKAEFKAIKKLVDEGFTNIGTMIPLVIRPEELRRAKEIAREVGLKPHDELKFGIMVETPASALIIEDFIAEGLDFISFGTNDLTQYTLALDRNNEHVAKLFSEKHKAVLKLIEMVIKKCRKAGVETSICGQAGSYPDVVEKLVRFGITSVSANPDAVELVRETVARTEKRLLLDKARGS